MDRLISITASWYIRDEIHRDRIASEQIRTETGHQDLDLDTGLLGQRKDNLGEKGSWGRDVS